MASNIARQLRQDRRRVGELLRRWARGGRGAQVARDDALRELRCQLAAERAELYGYVWRGLADLRPAVTRALEQADALDGLLGDLERQPESSSHPAPGELVDMLHRGMAAHGAADEEILTALEQRVEVVRLRQLGESYRRTKQASSRRAAAPREPVTSRAELYLRAQRAGIAGRSRMSKDELRAALRSQPRGGLP